MWWIHDLEARDVQLNFSSSGGGHPRTQAIYTDATCLINTTSFIKLDEDAAQLIVCESCGHIHCEPGGWVHLRRIGEAIVFIPSFSEMLRGEFERTEYAPPDYVTSRGIPTFSREVYEQLLQFAPAFPAVTAIKSLTAAEAVRLIQWTAPLQVLGRFPSRPFLAEDTILAVDSGQLEEQCHRLQEFLDENVESEVELKPTSRECTPPLEFYLDGPGFPTWRPVASLEGTLVFNLGGGHQLMTTGNEL
ncbi:hypothetical protein [Rubinisphaera margarita]|uniref:hypothetical protein n=1 Tax=Rubinisphaera margarita TaxID=2909586 RepID=UPI001EE97617|nr:hypothetical protein [Rubinisphaera margarita]MCG6155646.1 hypothetical protein [Rubinisphaera margarita]